MDYWQSIILGIVEGITEFLPISSTAHLILAGKVLNINQTEFVKSFEIAIQLGAILAVVWVYWKKINLNKGILTRIIIAFLPTATFGFILYKIVKSYLMENLFIIAWTLLLGGIFIIIFEYLHKEKPEAVEDIENISYKQCFLIGTFQTIAMIPGVSRSAATIIGGLFLNIRRKTIVEFSFLLAVPTMMAATGYDLLKTGINFSLNEIGLLSIGFISSFIVSIIAIKFLLHYIQQNDFKWFGVYRIIIGLIYLLIVL
jgi:undecaprenyl-diphosphatase